MFTLNPTSPIVTTPATTARTPSSRQVVPSSAADKRKSRAHDRRAMLDRRGRRGAKHLMDRRFGPERRRSSIDLSV